MFTFIQKMEGVDFKGALKILAERAGVELVAEDPKKRDARENQYALLEEAAVYFFRMREENPAVTDYIEKRGVKQATMIAWRIGYAKDEWRALRSYLQAKGFTDGEMLSAGLIKHADAGKEPYDVFRDRIMFPIMDASGRVVAFSGRTLKQESGIPKYVNSPETELFQKSEILYGYDKAKHGIRQYNFSLVVEGQFDLVLAHQAGECRGVARRGPQQYRIDPRHGAPSCHRQDLRGLSKAADRTRPSPIMKGMTPTNIIQSGTSLWWWNRPWPPDSAQKNMPSPTPTHISVMPEPTEERSRQSWRSICASVSGGTVWPFSAMVS